MHDIRRLHWAGTEWAIHEVSTEHVPGARGPRCLLCESAGVIHRVWGYPPLDLVSGVVESVTRAAGSTSVSTSLIEDAVEVTRETYRAA